MPEILRTVFLMSFASRIYRDEAGSIYLLDGNRWSKVPKHIYKVPDTPTLELLMRETCWSGTHTAFACVTSLIALSFVLISGLHPAWVFLVLIPLLAMSFLGSRGVDVALQRCTRIPTKDSALVLTRWAEGARLDWVSFVRVCAVLGIVGAFVGSVALDGIVRPIVGEALTRLAPAMVAIIAAICFRLIIAGGHVLNRDRLDLSFENRN